MERVGALAAKEFQVGPHRVDHMARAYMRVCGRLRKKSKMLSAVAGVPLAARSAASWLQRSCK